MNQKHIERRPAGVPLGDVYHVLFRHKWKILVVWMLGLVAAVAVWHEWPVTYRAQARLLVHYVLNHKSNNPVTQSESVSQAFDKNGMDVINAEAQILRSFDLALKAADALGPSNLLRAAGSEFHAAGNERTEAAQLISQGLTVDLEPGTAVLGVSYQNRNPELVGPVLQQVVTSYLKWQAEIYRPPRWDEALGRQTDELRKRLEETDAELRSAKKQLGILSLDDSKKTYTDGIAKIRESLANAESDLIVRKSVLAEMTNTPSASEASNLTEKVPREKAEEYERTCRLLDNLRQLEAQLLVTYQPGSLRAEEARRRIEQSQNAKRRLESQYPELAGLNPARAEKPAFSREDVLRQKLAVKEIEARIGALQTQMSNLTQEAVAFDEMDGSISDLTRKKSLQETYLKNFSETLFRARIEEAMGSDRLSNISVIETPTPAVKTPDKLKKILAIIVFAAVAGGLGLALLIELYLDRSFKRPVEIRSYLHVPLLLSIPRLRLNGARGALHFRNASITEETTEKKKNNGAKAGSQALAERSSLAPYIEALRDGLILHFESRNLNHKPKLLAVTSCERGAGVSSITSGLAASLSETGDGNVLLVDLNGTERNAAALFQQGERRCGLSEALETETRAGAHVRDNLYVVSEATVNGDWNAVARKRFSNSIPRLRASDYDYIIFDMPPVSQVSSTSSLARFMDVVFLVVEAERTDRDKVKRAADLLAERQGSVGVVLNKCRNYVPRALQLEF